MNRWTGTGHLTKDPKLLETDGGTAICTLRIAVKRAGKQGHDGYFDVKCFDAQASACAQYLKAGREIAVPFSVSRNFGSFVRCPVPVQRFIACRSPRRQ